MDIEPALKQDDRSTDEIQEGAVGVQKSETIANRLLYDIEAPTLGFRRATTIANRCRATTLKRGVVVQAYSRLVSLFYCVSLLYFILPYVKVLSSAVESRHATAINC